METHELHVTRQEETTDDPLLELPALQEVWKQQEALREAWTQPEHADMQLRERSILQNVMRSPTFQAALTEMRSLPEEELATQFSADLKASYYQLGDHYPMSVHDLRKRMRYRDTITAQTTDPNVEPSAEEQQRRAEQNYAANTRDYLQQVLTGVKGLSDILTKRSGDQPSNDPLWALYQQQLKRLARLLVAMEHDARKPLDKAA